MTSFYSTVQVFGWDSRRTIIFNDVLCTNNLADERGGCFYGTGRSIVNNRTTMHDNEASQGGCICERCIYSCILELFILYHDSPPVWFENLVFIWSRGWKMVRIRFSMPPRWRALVLTNLLPKTQLWWHAPRVL